MSDEAPHAGIAASSSRAASDGAPAEARDPDRLPPERRHGALSVDDGTPASVLARLLEGNRRFFSGAARHGHDVTDARRRAEKPTPSALVIGCIDSRVPPEAILDQPFGEILSVRTAGHVLDSAALASVELAVSRMHVPLIVVLGHEDCAAVEYAVDATHRGEHPDGALGYLVRQIAPSVPTDDALSGTQTYEGAVRAHVTSVVAAVRALPAVAEAVADGRLGVAGVRYGVTHGRAEPLVEPA